MIRLFLPLLVIAACSTLADDPKAPVLDCHAVDCPTVEDVETAVYLFADRTTLDRSDAITVEWHAEGEQFAEWSDEDGHHYALGRTLDRDTVQVSSWRLLAHELMHVHLWRLTDNPDANHAEPPGPWSEAHDETIAAVKDDYEVAFSD